MRAPFASSLRQPAIKFLSLTTSEELRNQSDNSYQHFAELDEKVVFLRFFGVALPWLRSTMMI
jgi:hypothetical protein